MYNIIICEDNHAYGECLLKMVEIIINEFPQRYNVCCVTIDPFKVLELVDAEQDWILLLDIELESSINGFGLAEKIRDLFPQVYIIFVTGHKDFVFDAFKIAAIDYLVKPIDLAELKSAFQRIEVSNTNISKRFRSEENNKKKINIKNGSIRYEIKLEELLFIEKVKNQCFFYTEKLVISSYMTLIQCIELLAKSENFVQCHKGFIVNQDKITSVDLKKNQIFLGDMYRCDIGKNFRYLFKI